MLAAYERVVSARPDLDLELVLAGGRGGDPNCVTVVHQAMDRQAGKIKWYESAEYSLLRSLYQTCDFTVFPSELEGFGLPVIESLWFGRPCLCANFGSMAEMAVDGGCLTVDVRDLHALADAMLLLVAFPERLEELVEEIAVRPMKTWEEYASGLVTELA